MKRWAVITVGLYLAVALLLTVPVFLAYFAPMKEGHPFANSIASFREWGYWIWIGVSVLCQVLLLVVPVAVSERRPRSHRHVLVPVITAAFLLAFVCVSAVMSLEAGIWGDGGKLWVLFGDRGNTPLLATLSYLVMAWIVWGFVFRRFASSTDPELLICRLTRWLLRGSILELLVAVPSHIVSRHRHDCCAPMISFWGIVTGITVMLLAFGPGVFFLFAQRMRRL